MQPRWFGRICLGGFLLAAVGGAAACAGSDGEIGSGRSAAAAALPLTAATNLVANPSFESATATQPAAPVSWKSGSWGVNNAAFSYAADAHSGQRSGRIDITNYTTGDAKWVFDWVAVQGATNYVYADYYKSNASSKLVAAMQRSNGSVAYKTLSSLPASADWTQSSAALTTDPDCVRVSVYHLIAASGWLQIDDARLGPPDAPSLSSGVPNGSLEQASDLDSTLPLGWRSSSWGTSSPTFAYSDDAYEGTKSVSVSLSSYTSGDAKWLFEPVPVIANASYVYRHQYKSSVATKLVAAYQRADGSTTYQTLVNQVPASATWAPVIAGLTPPTGTVRASVYHVIAAVGTLQVDAASLVPGSTVDLSRNVPNGSFEQPSDTDPNRPLGWSTSAASGLNASFSYNAAPHSGSHAVALTVSNRSGGDAKWYYDAQPVTPGQRYEYSDYYTASVPSFATVRITRQNGSFLYLNLGRFAASDSYVSASIAFLAPADAVAATVFRGLDSNGTLSFDDAALTQLPAASLVNGVPNGDLEQLAYPGATMPAAFYSNKWGSNDATFSYAANGNQGTHGVNIAVASYTSGNATWYFDPQPVDSTKVYEFTARYRSTVDSNVQAQATLDDGSLVNLPLPHALAASDWTQYRARIYLPNRARALTVFQGIARVGTLFMDDLTLLPVTPAPLQRALVSLTFDDSWLSDYSSVLPLLSQHGLVATHYVITSLIGTANRLDLTMLKDLQARGDEVAPHTETHPDLTTLPQASLLQELQGSKDFLEANGFGPAANFASPYGAYSSATLSAIRQLYGSHRTTDTGFNAKDDFDIYRLSCQNIRSTTTLADVDAWAARAAAERTWLIITYHDVVDSGGSVYSTTPSGLDAQLSAIQARGLPVVTVRQALDEILPQLQSSAR